MSEPRTDSPADRAAAIVRAAREDSALIEMARDAAWEAERTGVAAWPSLTELAIDATEQRCERCGQRLAVSSGDESTTSDVPVVEHEVERLRAIAKAASTLYVESRYPRYTSEWRALGDALAQWGARRELSNRAIPRAT